MTVRKASLAKSRRFETNWQFLIRSPCWRCARVTGTFRISTQTLIKAPAATVTDSPLNTSHGILSGAAAETSWIMLVLPTPGWYVPFIGASLTPTCDRSFPYSQGRYDPITARADKNHELVRSSLTNSQI